MTNIITKKSGLDFLKAHQPMPGPEEQDYSTLLDEWVRVFSFFSDNPSEEAIPLFLASLGEDDGCGEYQCLGSGFFSLFSAETLAPHFTKALKSESPATRFWGSVFAMWCMSDDKEFIQALIDRLSGSEDERDYCLSHLKDLAENHMFTWRNNKEELEEYYQREEDPDRRKIYEDIFNENYED